MEVAVVGSGAAERDVEDAVGVGMCGEKRSFLCPKWTFVRTSAHVE